MPGYWLLFGWSGPWWGAWMPKATAMCKATSSQLWALNRAGLLELREVPGPRIRFGVAFELIAALEAAKEEKADDGR